ncbi:MAG: 4Fe-4S binding protein [Deltaproteobacteria bacterium]|nr:4Fe-4S binding protein [Deltaproteobacteria bacterium]
MSEQEEMKQRVTRKYPVSAEEQEKRRKAQKVLKILTKPKVIAIMGFMMGVVNAIKTPFRKTKPPDRALSKYLYFKAARWFYYYAQQAQRDDLVPPPIPEPDKATVSMIKDMVGELGLTSLSTDTNFYHGKVINNDEAKKILTVQEDINVAPSEKAMPFKVARQMILETQESFAAAPCLCRNATEESCVPKDRLSCIYVGKENVDFVAENSSWAQRITREEALNILDEAQKDGLVHTIFWNKWVGEGPFCICNCCSCHCGGIDAWNLSAGLIPMFSETGYVVQVDEDACTGCGKCVPSCHFEAISMDTVKKKAVIDEARCVGCEVCLGICEYGAKSMKRAPDKGEPFFEAVKQAKAG